MSSFKESIFMKAAVLGLLDIMSQNICASKDKGNVIENILHKSLHYNYWSGFSGLEDTAANYSLISYQIDSIADGKVKFTWTQEGFANEEGRQHSENALTGMLEQIKNIAEGK